MPTKKELEEQVDELKEEVELSGGVYSDFKNMKDERNGLKEAWERECEENQELKEEIDDLGDFKQKIIKELGCHYEPLMVGEDIDEYIIDEIKKLKQSNPGYETIEKLNKEYSELWDKKEELSTDLVKMESEKDSWIKDYFNLEKEKEEIIDWVKEYPEEYGGLIGLINKLSE